MMGVFNGVAALAAGDGTQFGGIAEDFGQRDLVALGVDAVEVGLAVSALLFFLVSRLTRQPPKAALEPFFPTPRRN